MIVDEGSRCTIEDVPPETYADIRPAATPLRPVASSVNVPPLDSTRRSDPVALVGNVIVYVPSAADVTGPATIAPEAFFKTIEAPVTGAAYTEPLIVVVAAGAASFDELPQPASKTIIPMTRTLHIFNLDTDIISS
jgi:hypothetical protein